jgi:hypothetical protein
MSWKELVPAPPRGSVNTKLILASDRQLLTVLGEPRLTYSDKCQAPTNPKLKGLLISADVGLASRQKVRGIAPAVDSLEKVLARVKEEEPTLHAVVGSAGMLCCRLTRGSTSRSHHSFGLPIDLTIEGELDQMGDGMVMKGTLALYRFFRDEGWIWGGGWRREDGMHFEPSWQLIKLWARNGFR